ncbi:MAG: hypothetical protein ACREP4_13110 [Stenotrophomonas sp.]|uniref:hypothetical protein n=1 Tax=Stenotrophomonas sp. TaxID=69392 RepID=UPI003D6D31DD
MDHPVISVIKWLFLLIGLVVVSASFFSEEEPILLFAIGTAFLFVGFAFSFFRFKQKRDARFLMAQGRLVSATILSVDLDEGLVVNGKCPWVITAQWHDPDLNEIHLFTSKSIWYDPSEFIHDHQVAVRIDPGNPRRYLMDISFLPNHKPALLEWS